MARVTLFLAMVAVATCSIYNGNVHQFLGSDRGIIRLRNGDVNTAHAEPHHAETRAISEWMTRVKGESDLHQYLIHVQGPITDAYRTSLEKALGLKMSMYIPHDTYLVPLTEEGALAASALPGVKWVGVYRPTYRTSPEVHHIRSLSAGVLLAELHAAVVPDVGAHLIDYQSLADAHFANTGLVVRMGVASSDKITAHISALDGALVGRDDVTRVAQWLAERPLVHWIEAAPEFFSKNFWARTAVQSGYGGTTPIYSQNLQGDGQIVGVGDTGLDASSCFFFDPNVAVPYNTVDQSHRKIVTYITFVDSGDYVDGHGTHVCGSVAGQVAFQPENITESTSRFNGMAPNAKLAFTDIGDPEGGLDLPNDLNTGYFPQPYAAGARIHSNSWGSSSSAYTLSALEFDKFIWNQKDFLVLVAAGNDGASGLFSVGSPATAKNVIAVAAAQNTKASFEFNLAKTTLALNVTSPAAQAGLLIGLLAGYSTQPEGPIVGNIVAANPFQACTPLTNTNMAGAIALVQRGTCNFVDKTAAAQAAGAVAVIVVNNVADSPIVMGGTPSASYSIPSAMITMDDGTPLYNFVNGGGLASGSVAQGPEPDLTNNPAYDISNMAGFSSRGPTADLRFKPDLSSPGQYVVSARSNGNSTENQCGDDWVLANQGTSMATPVMAGSAALVREYYVNGYYPTGVADPDNGFTPSAALLKATLIASGQYMDGLVEVFGNGFQSLSSLDRGRLPSVYQGYGRMQLDSVLLFANATFSTWLNDDSSVTTGDHDQHCFTLPAGGSMRVAVVWSDYPGMGSASVALVNNIDLVVSGPNGMLLGNNLQSVSGAGTVPIADVLNNVETVNITNALAGTYTVNVIGRSVPVGPQPYAIFVYGDITSTACTTLTVGCLPGCVAHGQCDAVTGLCTCNPGYFGADCSQGSEELILSHPAISTVGSFSWQYFTVQGDPAAAQDGSLNFYTARLSPVGDVDYFVRFGAMPTTSSYDVALTLDDNQHPTGSMSVATVQAGTYYVGVFGYCCGNVQFNLTTAYGAAAADVAKPDQIPNQPKSYGFATGLGVGLGVAAFLALVGGAIGYFVYRRRSVRYDHVPIPN